MTYAFADTHPAAACRVQKLRIGAPFKVPRLFGFTMPARGKDPETNALFKSVLFRPLRAAAGQRASRWVPFRGAVDENGSFAGAWDPWWEEQLSLSRQYEECERRAGKWFTIEDIDLRRAPPGNEAQYFDRFSVRPSAAQFMARWTVEAATNMDAVSYTHLTLPTSR